MTRNSVILQVKSPLKFRTAVGIGRGVLSEPLMYEGKGCSFNEKLRNYAHFIWIIVDIWQSIVGLNNKVHCYHSWFIRGLQVAIILDPKKIHNPRFL